MDRPKKSYKSVSVAPASEGNIINEFSEGNGIVQSDFPLLLASIDVVWYSLSENAIHGYVSSKLK